MTERESRLIVRDGMESLPEPLDLERIQPAGLPLRKAPIKLRVPDLVGTVIFAPGRQSQIE